MSNAKNMRRCKECGALLPCVKQNTVQLCKECDDQFKYCFYKCKFPCRSKEEQKNMYDRLNPGWDKAG